MNDCELGLGKTATGLGPGIRFESSGELKEASLLAGAWSCGVKSQVTEVVRVHLGIWDLCRAQDAMIMIVNVMNDLRMGLGYENGHWSGTRNPVRIRW